jgi:iron-sulfur cluster repair protein YtfE (RIC family)
MRLVRFKPHTTRGDLITRYPTAHGLLPAGSPEATIEDLANAAGIPVAIVMEMLARTCTPIRPDGSVLDWTQESVIDLIDYLQLDHHPYLIAELDRLEWLLQLDGACSSQLIGRMRAWIAGKHAHMQHEEGVLFPLCRELSGVGAQDSPTDSALRQMFSSHEQAGAMLLQLCEAFAQELKAGIADPAIRDLLTGLIEVLDLHVELEDTVLLPAVLFEAELQRTRRLRQSLRVLTEG